MTLIGIISGTQWAATVPFGLPARRAATVPSDATVHQTIALIGLAVDVQGAATLPSDPWGGDSAVICCGLQCPLHLLEPVLRWAVLFLCFPSPFFLPWAVFVRAMSWLRRMAQKVGQEEPARLRVLQRRHTPLIEVSHVIKGADFQDGSFVQKFADSCARKAVLKIGRPNFQLSLNWCSVCTGSGMDAVAIHAVESSCRHEQVNVGFNCSFFCELDKAKREWSKHVHHFLAQLKESVACAFQTSLSNDETREACAFDDLTQLKDPNKRTCYAHKLTRCALPPTTDIAIGGLSCKDFARCNANKGKLNGSDIYNSASTPGKSADCMRGFLDLIDTSPPEIILVENVDELADEALHRPALDLFLSDLSSRGYDSKIFILNSSDYGLPQHKRRMYLLGVLRPGRKLNIDDYGAFFQRVESLLDLFKMQGPSLAEALLPENDAAVTGVLAQRQAKPQTTVWQSGTLDAHRKAWAKLGLPFQPGRSHPSISKADLESPWFWTLTPRERDLIGYHQHTRKPGSDASLAKHAKFSCVDVGMSVTREANGSLNQDSKLTANTLLPNTSLYVSLSPDDPLSCGCDVHRCLLGEESLMFNGFPTRLECFKAMTAERHNSWLQDLAGNAFASTCIAALVMAIIFSLEAREAESFVCTEADSELVKQRFKKSRKV